MANFVRKVASSIAESPPPTTTSSRSRKKKPSQVAHALTPRPRSCSSPGTSSQRALAPGRDDHGLRPPRLVARLHEERTAREVDLGHVHGQDLGAEAGGLLLEPLHQLGSQEAVGEPRVVLDVGRQHELPAGVETLEHQGRQVRPGRVEGGRVPGRTRADHDHVAFVASWFANPPTAHERAGIPEHARPVSYGSDARRGDREDRAVLDRRDPDREHGRRARPLQGSRARSRGTPACPRTLARRTSHDLAGEAGEGLPQAGDAASVRPGPANRSAPGAVRWRLARRVAASHRLPARRRGRVEAAARIATIGRLLAARRRRSRSSSTCRRSGPDSVDGAGSALRRLPTCASSGRGAERGARRARRARRRRLPRAPGRPSTRVTGRAARRGASRRDALGREPRRRGRGRAGSGIVRRASRAAAAASTSVRHRAHESQVLVDARRARSGRGCRRRAARAVPGDASRFLLRRSRPGSGFPAGPPAVGAIEAHRGREREPAPVHPGLHGADGDLEHLRDLLVGHVLHVGEHERDAELLGDRASAEAASRVPATSSAWSATGGPGSCSRPSSAHDVQHRPTTLPAQLVVAGVHGDPMQPRREGRVATEPVDLPQHREERVLGDVGRGLGIAQDPQAERVDAMLVPSDQVGEGVGVACSEAPDEILVALGARSRPRTLHAARGRWPPSRRPAA